MAAAMAIEWLGRGIKNVGDSLLRSFDTLTGLPAPSKPEEDREELLEDDRDDQDGAPDVTPLTAKPISLKEFAERLCFGLIAVLLWENKNTTNLAVGIFNIVFWGCYFLNIGSIIAAYSAASLMLCYVDYATCSGEMNISCKLIRQTRKERFRKSYHKLHKAYKELSRKDNELTLVYSSAILAIIITFSLISEGIVFIIYFIFVVILTWTKFLLNKYEQKNKMNIPQRNYQLQRAASDSDEEFLLPATESNLEVLEWAGETGDNPPSPLYNIPAHRSNDSIYEDDLEGVEMPSHDEDCVDAGLDLCSEFEPRPILEKSYSESSSSSEDDDANLNLEPKKLDKNWVDDDSDTDFEIIDSRELENLGNV